MKTNILAIIAVFILLAGCSHSSQMENPAWVDKLIKQFESDTVANPPLSIWRYEYKG
jgi:hypothetical protein